MQYDILFIFLVNSCYDSAETWKSSKRAFKRATSWYAMELKKTDGKSSYEIASMVKREYDGVGPHPVTIRRYVKENLAGMSPLKPGVKGDVSPSVFSSLCAAFESYVCIQQLNLCQGEITLKKLVAHINSVLCHDYRKKSCNVSCW